MTTARTKPYTDPETGETWDMPDLGDAWCDECRRYRRIEDQFPDSTMTPRGEVEYQVTALVCGHQAEGPEHKVADAPGAPYAGPDVATGSGTSARALRAAREAQRHLDRLHHA